MKARLQHPMYTAAALAAANPVLLKGEVVYESDTLRRKVGDGSTAWNALPYESLGGPTSAGPFPGYRDIFGPGGGVRLNWGMGDLHIFATPLQPEMLIGRHILFDACISSVENSIESSYHLPAVYQKIQGLGEIPVVNHTTAHPYLTDSMATIFAFIGFEYDNTNITGFHFQTISNGFSKPEILSLKWFGIYLEEMQEPVA